MENIYAMAGSHNINTNVVQSQDYKIITVASRVLRTIIAYSDLLTKHALLLTEHSIAHFVWMSEVQA